MKYFVTYSEAYYPCGGCSDWVKVLDNKSEAHIFAQGLAAGKDSTGDVYVIQFNPETNEFKELDSIRCCYKYDSK